MTKNIVRVLTFVTIFLSFTRPSSAAPLTPTAVRVSNGSSSAPYAIDGNLNTSWEAGSGAPQWVVIDLGQPRTINRLILHIAQSPAGRTIHTIEGGSTDSSLNYIQRIDSITSRDRPLDLPLLSPLPNIRYLKITTTLSPSWISWKEIEVYEGTEKIPTNLKYYGYLSNDYHYQTPTYFSELDSLANTNIAWGNVNLSTFKSHRINVLYSPLNFWTRPSSGPDAGRLVLMPQWPEFWAKEKRDKIDPYIDSIYGFYMDEPVWNKVSKEDFWIFTEELKRSYPTKKIFVIEAAPPIRNQTIPTNYYKDVTDIGFDYYFTLEKANNEEGWVEYLDLTQKFTPYAAGKNYWLVPDGYGPPGWETRWADAYERYTGLSMTIPNAVGMVGFLYNLPNELKEGNVSLYHVLNPGQSLYNESFRNRQIEIGKSIINNYPIIPGDLNRDGHVNIYDFNLLISAFGSIYTLQDFNNLITNFGKVSLN